MNIFEKKKCFQIGEHISLSGTALFFYENIFDINFLCAFPEMEKKYYLQIVYEIQRIPRYRKLFCQFTEGWGLHIVKSDRTKIFLLKRT